MRVCSVDHRAGSHEEQPFEHRVVERMIKGSHESDDRQHRLTRGHSHHPHAGPHQDDADVFHAGISQQPLQVMLVQRIQDPEYRRERAEGQHQEPPPPGRSAQQVHAETDDPIDRRLDHHAREQRGGVRWRGRVRPGQPDVQRHDAGFGAEAKEGQQEYQVFGCFRSGPHCGRMRSQSCRWSYTG